MVRYLEKREDGVLSLTHSAPYIEWSYSQYADGHCQNADLIFFHLDLEKQCRVLLVSLIYLRETKRYGQGIQFYSIILLTKFTNDLYHHIQLKPKLEFFFFQ